MKKFKIISTCVAVVLMIALMSFGVYSLSTVSVTVSGTIKFECTDVYIDVTYGLVGGASYGPYSSQPGETMSWKDSQGETITFDKNNKLPDMTFTETTDSKMPSCTYFITVTNNHGMDIGLSLGYKWKDSAETKINNPIIATNRLTTLSSTVEEKNHGDQIADNASGVVYNASEYPFVANTTTTLFVTLTLSNEEYPATGSIQLVLSAAVKVGDVQNIIFS